eukprot:4833719-Lingulodinium_polyedra.AAC.1
MPQTPEAAEYMAWAGAAALLEADADANVRSDCLNVVRDVGAGPIKWNAAAYGGALFMAQRDLERSGAKAV